MTDNRRPTTRRQFLKTTAAASGSALILGIGCTNEDGSDGSGADENDSGITNEPPLSIGDYQIFSPGKIGNLDLKNRIVRSATGECSAVDGEVTDKYINVFTALAGGGAGMIISGSALATEGDGISVWIYAFDDMYIEGMKTVKDAVREVDPECKLIGQVAHTGYAIIGVGETRTGPSDISWPGDSKPMTPLSIDEIGEIVQDFAQAARRFKEAGWDGVEIHAAHGYLLSSFLSNYTNNRTDQYGGSVQNRARIVGEVMEETRKLVGDDFPIMIKLNSSDSGSYVGEGFEGGIDQELFVETAKEIVKMGVDDIDVRGNNWIECDVDEPQEQSLFPEAATALDVNVPVILTGGNRSLLPLEGILKEGKVDFFGMARPLIREPDLPNKWLKGESTQAKCISCNQCFYGIAGGLRCHQEPEV